MNPLTEQDLVQILTNVESSPFRKNEEVLQARGFELRYAKGVPEYVASQCPKETGARALANVTDCIFEEILYDPKRYATGNKVALTVEMIERILKEKS